MVARWSEVDDALGALDHVLDGIGPSARGQVLPAAVAGDEDDGATVEALGRYPFVHLDDQWQAPNPEDRYVRVGE